MPDLFLAGWTGLPVLDEFKCLFDFVVVDSLQDVGAWCKLTELGRAQGLCC